MVVEPKNVWEVCEFEDDVKYGRLDPARFVVELYNVLDGKADSLHRPTPLPDPHVSDREHEVSSEGALRRLSGKGGQPVFVLDTEFGGGKTHTLLGVSQLLAYPTPPHVCG